MMVPGTSAAPHCLLLTTVSCAFIIFILLQALRMAATVSFGLVALAHTAFGFRAHAVVTLQFVPPFSVTVVFFTSLPAVQS